ncbi:unnamed protein product [Rangifer tarandus platyrhynchus]|uniref:Uncharacterized protein n=2 Tax=Rangifer tarandus platyrhynchus TaxID=3082113 RepID=A0ACB0DRI2_RANTA|nr:unnamed protein product [Rangifer tarandus platyrhynchus]CAI9690699.1 unnamed protein product [Rangifer tarandus platyrhynchus]
MYFRSQKGLTGLSDVYITASPRSAPTGQFLPISEEEGKAGGGIHSRGTSGKQGLTMPSEQYVQNGFCEHYSNSQTPERGAPGALLRAREPRRSLPGIQAPRPRLTPLGAELRGGREPPAVPHLCSPKASFSAAAAAQEAAPHARRAAALRRALQPGKARAIAELGPSSLGATGPASEQGEETAPRADPPPPAPPPRRPRARQAPLTCPLPGRRRRRRLLAARRAPWLHAPSRMFCAPPERAPKASRSRGGDEEEEERASGGAAVRSRASGGLALTPHPGVEGGELSPERWVPAPATWAERGRGGEMG